MKANLLTLAAAMALLAGSLAWTNKAEAKPTRGLFGNINQTYYYGRGPAQYDRTNIPYPARPYPYYNNYGNAGNNAPSIIQRGRVYYR